MLAVALVVAVAVPGQATITDADFEAPVGLFLQDSQNQATSISEFRDTGMVMCSASLSEDPPEQRIYWTNEMNKSQENRTYFNYSYETGADARDTWTGNGSIYCDVQALDNQTHAAVHDPSDSNIALYTTGDGGATVSKEFLNQDSNYASDPRMVAWDEVNGASDARIGIFTVEKVDPAVSCCQVKYYEMDYDGGNRENVTVTSSGNWDQLAWAEAEVGGEGDFANLAVWDKSQDRCQWMRFDRGSQSLDNSQILAGSTVVDNKTNYPASGKECSVTFNPNQQRAEFLVGDNTGEFDAFAWNASAGDWDHLVEVNVGDCPDGQARVFSFWSTIEDRHIAHCPDSASSTRGTWTAQFNATGNDTAEWEGGGSDFRRGMATECGFKVCFSGTTFSSVRFKATVAEGEAPEPPVRISSDDNRSLIGGDPYESLTAVQTDYELDEDNVNVYVRDQGDFNDPVPVVQRLDASLNDLGARSPCEDPGWACEFFRDGLAVTVDNFPVVGTVEADLDLPAMLLMNRDLTTHTQGAKILADMNVGERPGHMSAQTGNNLTLVNNAQDSYARVDIPNTNEHVVDEFVVTGDVDLFASHWHHFTGDGGLFTHPADETDTGTIAENASITGQDRGFVHQDQVYTTDGGSVTKWNVSGGDYVEVASHSAEVSGVVGLEKSADGRYFLAVANDHVNLFNTTNLEFLNRTSTTDEFSGFRDADLDACNNYVFAVTDLEVVRYPVSNETTCEGFGGTDSTGPGGTNEPAEEDDQAFEDTDTTGSDGDPLVDESEDAVEEPTDPRDPVETTEGGLFGDTILTTIAQGLGVNLVGARVFLGGLLTMGMALTGAGMVGSAGRHRLAGGAIGGSAGVLISFGVGLFPLWMLVLIGLGFLAVIAAAWGG